MQNRSVAAVALVLGGALGFVAGRTVDATSGPARRTSAPESTAERFRKPERAESGVSSGRTARRRVRGRPARATDAALEIAPDEVAFVRDVLGDERARRAAARLDPNLSGMELLAEAFDRGIDVSSALESFESAAARVITGRGASHRFVAGADAVTEIALGDLEDGVTTIEFGAGRFRRRSSNWTEAGGSSHGAILRTSPSATSPSTRARC